MIKIQNNNKKKKEIMIRILNIGLYLFDMSIG